MRLEDHTIEEQVLYVVDHVSYFFVTNTYYHIFVIICSVYMMGYGIPMLIDEILKRDV
jgi:hypothetical protein